MTTHPAHAMAPGHGVTVPHTVRAASERSTGRMLGRMCHGVPVLRRDPTGALHPRAYVPVATVSGIDRVADPAGRRSTHTLHEEH